MQIVNRTHLTVRERAMLSLFLVALSTGGYTIIDAIASPGNLNWHNIIVVALVTTFATFGHTLATYLTTNGEIPLGTVLETGTSAVEKRVEPRERQFIAPPLTTRAEPIMLPDAPPLSNSGTTQTPIVQPPFIPPSSSQQN